MKEAALPAGLLAMAARRPSLPPSPLTLREKTDDTSGEDNDEKEAVASKGRKTANSQGRRKGRITRSMANGANSEEAVTPQQSAELGESRACCVTWGDFLNLSVHSGCQYPWGERFRDCVCGKGLRPSRAWKGLRGHQP